MTEGDAKSLGRSQGVERETGDALRQASATEPRCRRSAITSGTTDIHTKPVTLFIESAEKELYREPDGLMSRSTPLCARLHTARLDEVP
jgi:hypothetical protein